MTYWQNRGQESYAHNSVLSKIIDDISNSNWLLVNNEKRKPVEFTKAEFAVLIKMTVAEIDNNNIFRKINFKSDVIDTLPPREKNILNATSGYTDEEVAEALKEYNLKRQENQSQQEVEAKKITDEEVDDYIEENPVEVTIGSGYAGLTLEEITKRNESKPSGKAAGNSMPTSTMPRANTTSSEVLKEHGDTAEAIVYKHLLKMYEADDTIEIILQNENIQTVGYDIVIKKNGVIIEYIEVKSRSNTQAIDVELTGSQWKMAREFDGHATIKFTLCLVSLLKGKTPINFVGNPFTEWKNENIYASPINIITVPELEE